MNWWYSANSAAAVGANKSLGFAFTPTLSPRERGNFSGRAVKRLGVDRVAALLRVERRWDNGRRAFRSRRALPLRTGRDRSSLSRGERVGVRANRTCLFALRSHCGFFENHSGLADPEIPASIRVHRRFLFRPVGFTRGFGRLRDRSELRVVDLSALVAERLAQVHLRQPRIKRPAMLAGHDVAATVSLMRFAFSVGRGR